MDGADPNRDHSVGTHHERLFPHVATGIGPDVPAGRLMGVALVLVDLQRDFLSRAGLVPPEEPLVGRVAALLGEWRKLGLPVFHVQTVIHPDGTDRMPHWLRDDHWECVAGTPGVLPPLSLAPLPGETVVNKPFFSGFGNPDLHTGLQAAGADELVVAGIYLHGCVRSTVLDAYERGYTVWVADDAVGATEAEHAAHSRAWLHGRAATFAPTAEILQRFGNHP